MSARRRRRAAGSFLLALLLFFACPAPGLQAADGSWRVLSAGLELGVFPLVGAGVQGARIHILRVDPRRWELTLHGVEPGGNRGWSARAWALREGLVAAVNAGMYQADYRTHVGFMAADGRTFSRGMNSYLSAAAFAPVDPKDPPFRIFDLDETSLDEVRRRYRRIAQNLRLVKRPAQNRWTKQDRRWSEVALGEDGAGRALLIFSRTPLPLDRLNDALLALPIDLVAAQHLEGGSEAQLFVRAGGETLELFGGSGLGLFESSDLPAAGPIPNVIGVRARR